MSLQAVADHVAVAVPDVATAAARWRDELGGAVVNRFRNDVFEGLQYAYPAAGRADGPAKVELIAPATSGPSFLRSFLERHGSTVHHLTLKVADLRAAIAAVEAAGFEVVEVDLSGQRWREAFLRPSQIGGLVVQLAWSVAATDEEWAALSGFHIEPVRPDAAVLLGPRLVHPDLDAAASVWSRLGAAVARRRADASCDRDVLQVRWDGSPLEIEIVRGAVAAPAGLRFRVAGPLPADPRLGAPVLVP